ncbi:MAG: cation:proton antiporter [Myxococcota bacterium]
MHDAHEFFRSLTIVLAVAALTTVLFQRLRQPVVLGYILAGLIVGPNVPVPIVADPEIVQTLSELGVVLLMFSLGLEFSLGKLARVGPTAAITAVIQSALVALLGFGAARALGWSVLEAVFTGAILAISSTTIIAKVFDEERIGGRLRDLVVGILLVEDLIAVVFMAALTAVATGAGGSAGALALTMLELVAFLGALLVVGMLIVPRFIRSVVRIGRAETTLIASIGVCFATAFIAQEAGYSVALGAFLAGSLVAESGRSHDIGPLIVPVRDVFAAIFFVSVGMSLDPALLVSHWSAVAALTAVVIAGKIASVALGAFLTGSGTRTAIESGMSLAQIGEFSFIIAVLGERLGATGEFLYPVTIAVSALTTLSTPWLIRAAAPAATFVDRKLPRPLQTYATLYGAWLERLARPAPEARVAQRARLSKLLVLDTLALGALTAGAAWGLERGVAELVGASSAPAGFARALLIGIACALALPLVIGVARLSNRLGALLAASALPRGAARVDLDAAPRRALELTLKFGLALASAIVTLAIAQPFLPSVAAPLVLGALLAALALAIWRSAADLESHVRAGSQAVLEALASYARTDRGAPEAQPLDEIRALLHGLGEPVVVRLGGASPAAGASLAELNLRGRTGATVLAISRGAESLVAPAAGERLRAGDVLALAGTDDAVSAARAILLDPPAEPVPDPI